jgi:LytS/YehU family sensor histidine kinase
VASGVLATFVPMPPRTVSQGVVLNPGPSVHADVRVRAVAMSVVGMDAAFHGALAILIYARLRKARLAALDLARAELARSEANRKLLASRLDAARAQVDPSLVIERLELIESAYETDPTAADAELDELIAFLRGAIPRLRAEPLPEMQT